MAFDALNIITDIILVVFPIYLILSVQLSKARKFYFSLAFMARAAYVP